MTLSHIALRLEQEARMIHFLGGGGEVPSDHRVTAEINDKNGENQDAGKKKLELQKQTLDAAAKNPEVAQKDVMGKMMARIKTFMDQLTGRQQLVWSTDARKGEMAQQTRESDKSFKARKRQNAFTDGTANLAQALTGIGLLGPMEKTETQRKMVNKRLPGSDDVAAGEAKKKGAAEQPAKKEVAAARPESELKGKAAAEQPTGTTAVAANESKKAQEDIAKQTGVKEIQQGQAT